jgi:hypothetical protein
MDLTAQNGPVNHSDRQAGEKSVASPEPAATERNLLREESGFAGKLLRKKIDGGVQRIPSLGGQITRPKTTGHIWVKLGARTVGRRHLRMMLRAIGELMT